MNPLNGVRVLELSVAVAGPLVGRYLAQLGAEVIKVESRERAGALGMRGPLWAPPDLGPVSADLVAGNNTNNSDKRSVAIDLKHPEGRATLDRLIERSDVFLTNFSAPAITSLAIEYEDVRAVNQRIVYIAMPGYGSGPGPYRDYRSWGPNLSSVSGQDFMTGDADRPPVMTPTPLPDYISGYHGAVAVISALLHRRATGEGQGIDLSQFEATVACLGQFIGNVSSGGGEPQRMGNRSADIAPRGLFPCRGDDRWVAIAVESDEQWQALGRAAGQPAWALEARYQTTAGRLAHQDELERAMSEWTGLQTPYEVAYRLQAARVAAAPVQSGWEHLSDPQLQARGFWRVVRHHWLERDLIANLPIHYSDTPARVAHASPALGEGNHELLLRLLGLSDAEVSRMEDAGALSALATVPASAGALQRPYWPWALPLLGISAEPPTEELEPAGGSGDLPRAAVAPPDGAGPPTALAGLRIIDLSSALSAYGTKLLADLGADVIRVEPPAGSALRHVSPFKDGVSLFHAYVDSGKRSVTLDLDAVRDREAFEQLLASADVLYEGEPPGALAARGLDWKRLHTLNPRLIVVSVTPFGQSGPYRDWLAEDLTLWALSGMLPLSGYPDRQPVIPGTLLSYYFVGAVGAAATLGAVHARLRSGRGQQVDVSAHEVLIGSAGTRMPGLLEDPTPRTRTGSRSPGATPYGYYRCSDKLVCILALMTEHWRSLARWIHEETGIAEVLDERFTVSSQVRGTFNDEIEGYINALAGRYDGQSFCVEAQRRGIPAAPVNPVGDTLRDPHLAARGGYWVDVEQPGLGVVRWPGAPYRLSVTPWRSQRPAPSRGQHNAEILAGIASGSLAERSR